MLYAIDNKGNRFSAETAKKGNNFYCEMCGEQVVLRQGDERVAHFAHKSDSECIDTWSRDMSNWHSNWQKKFPEDCREIVKELDGVKHRADILIEKTKTVIEFQHSPLSNDEFLERNRFYIALGYKVVWVFDFTKDYEEFSFERRSGKENEYFYYWNNSRETFENFDIKSSKPNVVIYFQIQLDAKDNEILKEYEERKKVFGHIGVNYPYYEQHKNDRVKLWKINCNNQDFSIFAHSGEWLQECEVEKYFFRKE